MLTITQKHKSSRPDQLLFNPLRSFTTIEYDKLIEPRVLKTNEKIGDVFDMLRRYRIISKISTGFFSIVYLVERRVHHDNTKIALKFITKTDFHRKVQIQSPRANIEAIIHLRLKHPNIIEIYEYHEDFYHQVFLMEYAQTDLFERIRTITLSDKTISNYIQQITNALEYCHKNEIIHRDLKSENVLLTNDETVKLCDFGLASQNKISDRQCGTTEYMAPEVVLNFEYDYKIDIWALGVLLYEMYYSFTPFMRNLFTTTTEQQLDKSIIMYNILHVDASFPPLGNRSIPKTAIDLINKLLKKSSSLRPNHQEIYTHSFISNS